MAIVRGAERCGRHPHLRLTREAPMSNPSLTAAREALREAVAEGYWSDKIDPAIDALLLAAKAEGKRECSAKWDEIVGGDELHTDIAVFVEWLADGSGSA